jgi:hypothetical protein
MAAPTLIQGVKAPTNLATGREDIEFMKGIAILEPTKNPLLVLSMGMAIYESGTHEFDLFEKRTVPTQTTFASFTSASNATTDYSMVLATGGSQIFAAGDIIRIEETQEMLLCISSTGGVSTETIVVVRDYGYAIESWTSKAAACVAGYHLTKIGNSFKPGHPFPTVISTAEDLRKNYTQQQRTPFGLLDEVYNSRLRGAQEWALEQRRAGLEQNLKFENTFFWGKPCAGTRSKYTAHTSSTTDTPAMTGGINHYIEIFNDSNLMVDETELTMFEFMDYLEAVMDKGGREKIHAGPPAMRTALEKWGITKMNTFAGDKVMGVPVGTWESANGILHFVTADVLKRQAATLYNYTFTIDADNIGIVVGPMGANHLGDLMTYVNNGGIQEHLQEYLGDQGHLFRHMETHGRLRFISVSAS